MDTNDDENLERVFAQMTETCKRVIDTLRRKSNDYGDIRKNDPFGAFGVLVRMNDKMRRLIQLHGKDGGAVNESVADTVEDLIGYALWFAHMRSGKA